MQYKLDRHAAKISGLSPGDKGKYEFLADEDVLTVLIGLDAVETASQKVVHKTAEVVAGESIGNKIAEKPVKSKSVLGGNWRNVKEIVILQKTEKKRKDKKYYTN